MTVTVSYYLGLSAIIFSIGVAGVLLRKNAIVILMAVELMLNAANLTFVAVAREMGQTDGQVIVFFVMTVAAAEAVVGLAIVLSLYRNRRTLDATETRTLWG